MSILKHNGIEITVDIGGKFRATVAGKQLSAGTMATLKKKIDQMKPFEPFKAIVTRYDWDGYDLDEITGIKKVRRRHHDRIVFVDKRGSEYHNGVIRATPENIAIADALVKLMMKNNKLRNQMEDAEVELKDKLRVELPPKEL